MRAVRKPLVVLTVLASAALACTLQEFLTTETPPGPADTALPPGVTSPLAITPGEWQPAGPEGTQAPRRIDLPPTPTPLTLTDPNDSRAILDLARPDHFDYFDNPDTWFDYSNDQVTYRIENGHLLGIDHKPGSPIIYWSFNSMQAGNTYAEVTASNGDCIEKDAVGFTIRLDPEATFAGYGLEVSCDGAWRFRLFRGTGAKALVDWTPSEVIHTGPFAVNRLGIWANERIFVIFINGTQVGDASDERYTYIMGYFTLYVLASRTYDLTATFDDFAFWHIPRQR